MPVIIPPAMKLGGWYTGITLSVCLFVDAHARLGKMVSDA